LPQTKAGRVLVTSLNKDWQNVTKKIQLGDFTPSEATDYILQSIENVLDGNDENLTKLANEMEHLPLALSYACAYINATTMKISDYIELCKEKKSKNETIIPHCELDDYKSGDRYLAVDTTWSISIDQVKTSCSDGVYLLNLCAFMAAESIPIELIKTGSHRLHDPGPEILSTKTRFLEAKRSLLKYTLVLAGNEILSMHRLLQRVIRHKMDDNEKSKWIESLIKTIDAILPEDTNIKENRDIYLQMLPHVSNIIRLAEENSIQDIDINESIISLISKVSTFLFKIGDYRKHIKCQERCLRICNRIGNKIAMAECLTKIGTGYNWLGDYDKDIEFQKECLKVCTEIRSLQEEADFDSDLGITKIKLNEILDKIEADCYIGIGKANHNLGKYKVAINNYKISLDICKKISYHSGELDCNINLGVANYRLASFKEDINYQEESLKICKLIDGNQEESICKCYINLGNANLSLGDLDKALYYQNKSLEICKGHYRQMESACYNNKGVIYHSRDDHQQAIEYLRKSIDINQEIGEKQGNTKSYGNLGNIYHSLGDHEGAIKCITESLEICHAIRDEQGRATCYHN
jgi:tetratricopeptide (TPR) repeat protein